MICNLSTNIVADAGREGGQGKEPDHLPQGARTSRASTPPTSSSTTSAAAASTRASGSTSMEWAEVGKTAVFFHNGGASETCIGNYWYQTYAGGEWWNLTPRRAVPAPQLLPATSTSWPPLVTDMLAGKEVVVPCMVDGNKDDLHLRRARSSGCRPASSCRLQPEARFRRLGRRGLPPAQRHARLHALFRPDAGRSRRPGDRLPSTSTATASPTSAWSAPAGRPAAERRRVAQRDQPARPDGRLPGRRLGRLQRRRHARPAAGHAERAEALHQPRQGQLPRRQPSAAARSPATT